MFSSRLHADFTPNPITQLLQAKRTAGERILDLTESNPTQAGLIYPNAEILAALSDPAALRYHPNPAGAIEAREAVSAYYAARGQPVSPDRILLTSSTSEAYAFLFKLLCNPGDEILVPRPSYPLFDYLAAMESVTVKQYPLVYENRWMVDLAALDAAIAPRTRAIVVVHPNNPTGSFLKDDELRHIRNLGLPVLSDEVFLDYAHDSEPRASAVSIPGGALTFAMSGLSKVAGLPQMKLGWIVVAGPVDLAASAFERLEWIADTYLSVGAPVQCAAAKLLALQMSGKIRARVLENLAELRRQIAPDSPFRILNVEGGWYATLEVPRTRTEEEWTLGLLRHHNVLVQPGYFYDFEREAFLVLSLLPPPDVFSEGLQKLLVNEPANYL